MTGEKQGEQVGYKVYVYPAEDEIVKEVRAKHGNCGVSAAVRFIINDWHALKQHQLVQQYARDNELKDRQAEHPRADGRAENP